jgi:hypothetical protein
MSYFDDIDQRQLKRGKFGPLDVYPQEDKQKEVSASFYFSFAVFSNQKTNHLKMRFK